MLEIAILIVEEAFREGIIIEKKGKLDIDYILLETVGISLSAMKQSYEKPD